MTLKVGVRLAEVLERQGRQELEVHQRPVPAVLPHPLDFRPHPFNETGKVLLSDGFHAHTDPLGYLVKRGRRVQPHSQPCCRKDGRDHRRGAALSLGACDVNRWDGEVRVAESFEQSRYALKVERRVPGAVRPALEIGKAHRAPYGRRIIELIRILNGDAQ